MSLGDPNAELPEAEDPAGPRVGQYRGSNTRYADPNCATQDCPYVLVTELPYERQIDEPDDAYHARLYRRFQVAQEHRNHREILAIFTALQTDLGVPEDGIHVPCRDDKEWLTFAYLQGVHPDAWHYAEIETPSELDAWYADEPYARGFNLVKSLRDMYESFSPIGSTLFLGPDGMQYRMAGSAPEIGSFHSGETRTLAALIRMIARELQITPTTIVELPDANRIQYQTTEPEQTMLRSIAFEYEVFDPGPDVDHGENVLLAQVGDATGARNGNFIGPFDRPTGQAHMNLGTQPFARRAMLVHNGRGGPFGSLYRTGLQSVLRNSGMSQTQFRQLRTTNPSQYRSIQQRALQSARMRIPGVQRDMRGHTRAGEAQVRAAGGTPNFTTTRTTVDGSPVFVKPDGYRGSVVMEVKGGNSIQANTRQIQGMHRLATSSDGRFELHLPHGKPVSGPLRSLNERGGNGFSIIRY